MSAHLSTERPELIVTWPLIGKVCLICEQFRGQHQYDTIGSPVGRVVCRRCLRVPDSLQHDAWGAYKARKKREVA